MKIMNKILLLASLSLVIITPTSAQEKGILSENIGQNSYSGFEMNPSSLICLIEEKEETIENLQMRVKELVEENQLALSSSEKAQGQIKELQHLLHNMEEFIHQLKHKMSTMIRRN